MTETYDEDAPSPEAGPSDPRARFMSPRAAADELGVTEAQVMSLLRSGVLRAIKVGGRGFWRIERSVLEEYIAESYSSTQEYVRQQTWRYVPPPSEES